ncbi:MAG: bacterial Ig-like domain-containing protein [Oscillospiraceae bacterium]|nr:bacterial Ig-like domain-containing protein [Oscillospiraceae bacterium]
MKQQKHIMIRIIAFILTAALLSGTAPAFTGEETGPSVFITIGSASGNDLRDGMRVSASGDGQSPVREQNGGQWSLRARDFIYFFIDADAVRDAKTVIFEVTFFDNAAGSFSLQYCHDDTAFYGVSFAKSGSGEYVTAKVTLENCSFRRSGHNQGAQFRFGGGAIIRGVRITVGTLPDPALTPPPVFAEQTELNNMIGKGIAGYQAWFSAGADTNWHHWAANSGGRAPGPGTTNVEMWPDVTDYEKNGAVLHQTNLADLGGGDKARLFNSRDRAVIRTHFQWMRDYGIDGAAVQRFYGDSSAVNTTAPNHLMTIRDAAEETGRIFYVMYDMSGTYSRNTADLVKHLKADVVYNIERVATSPNYAHADGKPVICIWGVHAVHENNWMRIDAVNEMVRWLRERGYYIIGGTPDSPSNWNNTTGSGRSVAGREMYASFDMLSPWMVGRFGSNLSGVTSWMNSNIPAGQTFCGNNKKANGQNIDFQPVVWPGFGWTNMPANTGGPNSHPRRAGQFVWDQVYTLLNTHKVRNLYFAMFDEYDEATAYMKAGRDYFDIPTDQYFLTLAADGTWLSSDFYLRAAGGCIEMLKGDRPLAATVDIPHAQGPVYWRNSFERRDGRAKVNSGGTIVIEPRPDQPLDVCVPNGGAVTGRTSGIATAGRVNGMIKGDAKSGASSFRLGGTVNGANGRYTYKIADTKVTVETNLVLRFFLKPENAGGQRVFVDLQFRDGSWLSDYPECEALQIRGTVGEWTGAEIYLSGSLKGKTIIGVAAAYAGTVSSGGFSALIDDIVIADTERKLDNIAVTAQPDRKNYVAGQIFDPAGMIVTAYYSDGRSAEVTGYTVSPAGGLPVGDNQTITVSYSEGDVTKTAEITGINVIPKALESIAVTAPPDRTSYIAGQPFDPAGMVVTAVYNDGATAAVTGYTHSPSGALLAGSNQTVTISYTENGVTKTAAITGINVVPKALESIAVTTPPDRTQYIAGQLFDPAGMAVTAAYNDGSTAVVTGYTFSPAGGLAAGNNQTVTLSYTEDDVTKTAEITGITVIERMIVKIQVLTPPAKIHYVAGERFETAGLSITAVYNDGSSETVSSGFTVSPDGVLAVADNKIIVSYGGQTAEIGITVVKRPTIWGNVSGSGVLGITDARMVLQFLVEKITLTEEQQDIADVDGKDGVTITDARWILQKIVDKIDRFPREK